jgi:hypothetical protein
MSPLRTLASTSSNPRSDRSIGLFAAKTRALQMSDTAITMYSGDVQESVGLVGAAPATVVVNTRSNIQGSAFVLWHASSYPSCSRWPDVWLARMPRTGFPWASKTSPPGRRCFGRMGVPASPTRSIWGRTGPGTARPWRSGMARSRTTMRTHPTTTNGTRTLDARVHPGDGRAGFWEPL